MIYLYIFLFKYIYISTHTYLFRFVHIDILTILNLIVIIYRHTLYIGFPEQHPVRLPREQESCLKDTKSDDCPNKNNAYTLIKQL